MSLVRGAAGAAAPHLPRGAGAGPGPEGCSSAFGTFGELLQGVLPGTAGDFLVTLPIAQWSRARFELRTWSETVTVSPPSKTKALALARRALDVHGVGGGGQLTIASALPEGKGLASSSADLVATARAVANAIGVALLAPAVERLLRPIEPTDGVMYPGIVVFDHRSVRLRAFLGPLPRMIVVAVDEGGTVDTLAFNEIKKPFSAGDRRTYRRLLGALTTAIRDRDLVTVGRVATESARLNQVVHHKRYLDDLEAICRAAGALGVVATHSGTMLGVLLDEADPRLRPKLAFVVGACRILTRRVSIFRTLAFSR